MHVKKSKSISWPVPFKEGEMLMLPSNSFTFQQKQAGALEDEKAGSTPACIRCRVDQLVCNPHIIIIYMKTQSFKVITFEAGVGGFKFL